MIALLASLTLPTMEPVTLCAANGATQIARKINRIQLLGCFTTPP
jgi:hypothetical protein